MVFPKIVGIQSDSYFQLIGVNNVQFRYVVDPSSDPQETIVIAPNPLYQHLGVQPIANFANEMNNPENLDVWELSVPWQDWAKFFGGISLLEDAIAPRRPWEINYDGTWRKYRTYGEPKRNFIRHTIKLVSEPFPR